VGLAVGVAEGVPVAVGAGVGEVATGVGVGVGLGVGVEVGLGVGLGVGFAATVLCTGVGDLAGVGRFPTAGNSGLQATSERIPARIAPANLPLLAERPLVTSEMSDEQGPGL
jgi:hypothetical protein